jgi:2-succinyl-6-hydroxy-2,4-cyclohexadiene-1-carboxylate synthase
MTCALLHGFAGDPASWDDVIAAWRLRAVPDAIALPGHGGGLVQPSWEANLEVIGEAVAGCELVVGYSLGARVALGLVMTGRCERAVLVSVNPGIPDAERAARRASDAGWAAKLRTDGLDAFADAWTAQPLFASQATAPPARLAARRARRLALDAEQLARSLEVMGLAEMPDYRALLDPLGRRLPLLPPSLTFSDRVSLIVGADDAKYVAIARALGLPCEVIAQSGHDPTLEQPAALAAAIKRLGS